MQCWVILHDGVRKQAPLTWHVLVYGISRSHLFRAGNCIKAHTVPSLLSRRMEVLRRREQHLGGGCRLGEMRFFLTADFFHMSLLTLLERAANQMATGKHVKKALLE